MELSSPMDRPVAVRHTPWWALLRQNRAKESSQEPSHKLSPSPKMMSAKLISFAAALSKSTTNRSTTYWARTARRRKIWRNALKKECLWKIYCRSRWAAYLRCKNICRLALRIELWGPPTWMLNLRDRIASLPSILIPRRVIKQEIRSTKLPNLT